MSTTRPVILTFDPVTSTTRIDGGPARPEPDGPAGVARHARLLTNLGQAAVIRVAHPGGDR